MGLPPFLCIELVVSSEEDPTFNDRVKLCNLHGIASVSNTTVVALSGVLYGCGRLISQIQIVVWEWT